MQDRRGGPSNQPQGGRLPPYVWPGTRNAYGADAGDAAYGEQQRFAGDNMYYSKGGAATPGGDFGRDGGMGHMPPGDGYGSGVDMVSMKSGSSGRMRGGYRRGGPIVQTRIHMNLVQKPARAYAAKQVATIRDLKRRGYELYYRAKQEAGDNLMELSVKMNGIKSGLQNDMNSSLEEQDAKMAAHVEKRLAEI